MEENEMEERPNGNERMTVAGARLFTGELILCLSEIIRVAKEKTIYPDKIATLLARILVRWEPYATEKLRMPPAQAEENATGFSRVGIIQDAETALRPLPLLYEALSRSQPDFFADAPPVRDRLVGAVLMLRSLRNKRGIREAVDDLLRPKSYAS